MNHIVSGVTADELIQQGLECYDANSFGAAEVLARAARAIEPAHPLARNLQAGSLFQLARGRLAAGELAGAEQALREVAALRVAIPGLHEALADCLFQQARALRGQDRTEEAIGKAREALDVHPPHQGAKLLLAECLYLSSIASFNGRAFERSLAEVREALALRPHFPEAEAILPYAALLSAAPNSVDSQGRTITPYLEMDISYTCNLHCAFCTHYSNYTVKGNVDFETGRNWILNWGRRLYPKMFRLLGGEPTLNPRLCDYIRLAHQVWPHASRELVTNGFFVRRHPDLFQVLGETRTGVQISIHEDTQEYREKSNLALLQEASARHGFRLRILGQTQEAFYRLYDGEGAAMRPFNDRQPAKSWRSCGNGNCQTLHLGRIWKCPAIAFLNNVDEMFDLAAVPEWQPYLQHKGLSPDASDKELAAYIQKPSWFCAMCPAERVMA